MRRKREGHNEAWYISGAGSSIKTQKFSKYINSSKKPKQNKPNGSRPKLYFFKKQVGGEGRIEGPLLGQFIFSAWRMPY